MAHFLLANRVGQASPQSAKQRRCHEHRAMQHINKEEATGKIIKPRQVLDGNRHQTPTPW